MPDLLAHFPEGFTPRPEQARLLAGLADALAEIEDDRQAPRVLLVEAPPGVGKSHVAMALARWSGDAYLLTSQRHLQDQYEREFGSDLALVKGRDNYLCERYPGAAVPTSRGLCRRVRGPACGCPYVRAKQAALQAPIFCTNTAYFATLRHWHAEQLRKRRLLVIDEAHNLESQLVGVFTARFSFEEMRAWFGHPLPRLATGRRIPTRSWPSTSPGCETRLAEIGRALEALRPPELPEDLFLGMPPTREEQDLLEQRDVLETALARITFFLDAEDREWIVRYPADARGGPGARPAERGRHGARAPGGVRGRDRAVLGLPGPPRGPRRVLRSRGVRAAALHRSTRRSCWSSARSSIAPSARCRRPPCPGWSPRCSPRWRRSLPPIPPTRG